MMTANNAMAIPTIIHINDFLSCVAGIPVGKVTVVGETIGEEEV